jgi:hypothetical protein
MVMMFLVSFALAYFIAKLFKQNRELKERMNKIEKEWKGEWEHDNIAPRR